MRGVGRGRAAMRAAWARCGVRKDVPEDQSAGGLCSLCQCAVCGCPRLEEEDEEECARAHHLPCGAHVADELGARLGRLLDHEPTDRHHDRRRDGEHEADLQDEGMHSGGPWGRFRLDGADLVEGERPPEGTLVLLSVHPQPDEHVPVATSAPRCTVATRGGFDGVRRTRRSGRRCA